MTRNEAALLGLKTYNTGRPCKRGHTVDRYTTTGSCAACAKVAATEYVRSRNALIGRVVEPLTVTAPRQHHQAIREYALLLTLATPRPSITEADTPAARLGHL